MAKVRKEDHGSYLLVENHCPICAAANACQGFCATELDLFRSVLGPEVHIERVELRFAGAGFRLEARRRNLPTFSNTLRLNHASSSLGPQASRLQGVAKQSSSLFLMVVLTATPLQARRLRSQRRACALFEGYY